jgi:hypothetical protein
MVLDRKRQDDDYASISRFRGIASCAKLESQNAEGIAKLLGSFVPFGIRLIRDLRMLSLLR